MKEVSSNKYPAKKDAVPRILFYIANYFIFRTAPIGYLHEICQKYPVIFVAEKFDEETERIVRDRSLFPKLEKIIPIRQFTGEKQNIFLKNFYLYNLAKKIIKEEKPDIVVASSDFQSMFELYLMRLARKQNILKIALQTANVGESKLIEKRVDLTNAFIRIPKFLPLPLRMFFVKLRKYLGHFLYYWILPLTVLEKPFFGKSSYILYKGNSGMRDADYQAVFSRRDRDIFLKDGVEKEKIKIIIHPLKTKTRKFFEEILWKKGKKKNEKTALLLLPEDLVGFKRSDFSLIKERQVSDCRRDIVKTVLEILEGWTIYLKPHPDIKDIQRFIRPFLSFSPRLKIVGKDEPIDKYIQSSSAIIELPLAAGNTLFLASLQRPKALVIALDFLGEILGDYYKGFPGVEYIDDKDSFLKILELIKKDKYRRKDLNDDSFGFQGIVKFLESVIKKNK